MDNLNKIRDIYQQGILDNLIIEHPSCLEILDDDIRKKFDDLRILALNKMNSILSDAKLESIESELIHRI